MAHWTAEEDQILITERSNGKSRDEIAKILNRTIRQLKYRIAYLGIQNYGWTAEEDELLKKLRNDNKTYREIGIIFNMKTKSIAARCYTLKLDRKYAILDSGQNKEVDQLLDFGLGDEEISKGLNLPIYKIRYKRISREKSKFWTKEEEDKLKECLENKLSNKDIAKELNRGFYSVYSKAAQLKLLPPRNWSLEEINTLKELVGLNYSYTNIAKQMNRTFKSVYRKVTRLKLSNKKIVKDLSQEEFRLEHFIEKMWSARSRASKKGLPFNLDEDTIKSIWFKQNGKCFYTKLPMNSISGGDLGWSIDRIDSNNGYTSDNIVLSCWMVNRMKSNMTLGSFIEICKLITENFNQNSEYLINK